MLKSIARTLIVVWTMFSGISLAHASQISGSFSVSSTAGQALVPVNGSTGATTTLGTATGLDFTTTIVSGIPQKTPGVAGAFTVNNATYDFIPLVGTVGSIRDFTFKLTGSANYPNAPISMFESGVNGLKVDMNTVSVVSQTSTSLTLTGTATFYLNGFDPTPGAFVLTANSSGNTFSFSASESATCSGAIGDLVWNDLNDNGIQDMNEPGIANVLVQLFDSQNSMPIAATMTDSNGVYHFTRLCANTYKVLIPIPQAPLTGYQAVPSFVGGDATKDSNGVADANGNIAASVSLPSGTTDNTIDFGFFFPPPQLQVIKTPDGGPLDGTFAPGAALTFKIIVKNIGGNPANNVVLSDTLPGNGNLQWLYYTTSQGSCTLNNNQLNCSLGPLPAASSATITVQSDATSATSCQYQYNAAAIASADNAASAQDSGKLICSSTELTQKSITPAATVDPNTPVTIVVSEKNTSGSTIDAVYVTGSPCSIWLHNGSPDLFSLNPGESADFTCTFNPLTTTSWTATGHGTDLLGNEVPPTGETTSGTVTVNVAANCLAITAVQGVFVSTGPMSGSGGTGGPYTFSATGLPSGLTMANDGSISGTPSVSGTFSYTVTVTDKDGHTGTVNCSVTVNPAPSATCLVITAVQGSPVTTGPMSGSGGTGGPYTFSATGLPSGLTMANDGSISGTPSVSGTFSYTVTVTDKDGHTGTVNCSVTVNPAPSATCLVITAVQGSPVTTGPMSGSGGTGGPYTFSATGLPAGLTMTSDGSVSGTPSLSGTFSYTVTVTDKDGHTGTINCSVTVNPSPSATCLAITAVQGSPVSTGPMSGSGGTGAPYMFSVAGLPSGLTMASNGAISGIPTVSGTFNYTVTVKDKDGHVGTLNCSLMVSPPPPMLTKSPSPSSLSNPFGTVTYTYTVTNSSGVTLTNVKVTDDNGTPGYPGDNFVVATIPSLGPGASQTFTVQRIPSITECATVNSIPNTPGGILIAQVLSTGDVKITFRQNTAIVDNTYGANASAGWTKGHKFSDFTGSDMAEFQIFDGRANKVLDFQFDYLTSSTSYPSGYGTLGPSGGDGKLIVGNAAWVLGVLSPATLSDNTTVVRSTTTMTTNLNQSAAYYGYTTNSPSTSDPNYSGWDLVDGYTVYISKAAFGSNAFGSVTVPLVHNSPPKIGSNALYPAPCSSYSVTNTAVLTDDQNVGATATATVNVGPPASSKLLLTKTANQTAVTAGSPVTYTYVVKNTGTAAVTNVAVVDDNGTPDNPADDFTVGTLPSLAGGASQTFTKTVTLMSSVDPTAVCQVINGTTTIIGNLVVTQLPSGAVLPNGNIVGSAGATQVVYRQSMSVVDNNYGTAATTATGWSNGHKFSDFTGSDMAEFRFTDKNGFGALDLAIDYLTAGASATYYTASGTAATMTYPSGYGTLGTGGDGKIYLGTASALLYYTTTITMNLNQSPAYYGLITNSPLPSSPLFGGWELVDGYTVVVNNNVFGTAGFGGASVPLVHNSPSKLGFNKFVPGLCGAPLTNTATAGALDSSNNTVKAAAQATVQVNNATASNQFVTINQSDWGGDVGAVHDLLASTFSTVYGSAGLKVGGGGPGGKSIVLTTALAIQDFLPQGGAASKLTMNYTLTGASTDADTTAAGALAGNVLALKLNVDYSSKGYLPIGFGDYVPTFITFGPFKGKKVTDILNTAMGVLGGGPLPPGVTYDSLNATLDQINNLFPQ